MVIRAFPQVEDFLDDLSPKQRAEVDAILEDLKDYGLEVPLVSMRQIKGKLWEIRIKQFRIFYVMVGSSSMVLLHAYKKQGQKAPKREVETALARMKNLLEDG